jgi:hypothetical protein
MKRRALAGAARQSARRRPARIEFPLTGHDLTAVTRRYVNLLRED